MKAFFSRMNPMLRGFLLIALVAAVIVVLSLENTVVSLLLLARIAFLLAIALFVFLVWREQRSDIEMWPTRAKTVFYGAAVLIVADFGVWFLGDLDVLDGLAFFLVLFGFGFVMWRVWRDQRTYA